MRILVRAKKDVPLRGEFTIIEVLLFRGETLPRDLLPVFKNIEMDIEGHVTIMGELLRPDDNYPQDVVGARAFMIRKPIPMWILDQLEEKEDIEINTDHLLEQFEVDLKDSATTDIDTTFCAAFK